MRVSHTGNQSVQGSDVSSTRQSDRARHSRRGESMSEAERYRSGADGVEANISARARELAHAKKIAHDAPDVREEKIAELKRRIAAGQYDVDPHALADRIVNEHIRTHGIG